MSKTIAKLNRGLFENIRLFPYKLELQGKDALEFNEKKEAGDRDGQKSI